MTTTSEVSTDTPRPTALEQAEILGQSIREHVGDEAFAALRNWLAVELEREQYARLEQAGANPEARIALAQVFVDLNVSLTPADDVDPDSGRSDGFGFLRYVCLSAGERPKRGVGRRRIGPVSGEILPAEPSESKLEGLVLVGGPGQGKSTLGQLLCQLHRAWLLKPVCGSLPKDAQKKAVDVFTSESAIKALGCPAELAFPIRIILPDAAAWIMEQPVHEIHEDTPILLRHVAAKAKDGSVPIASKDLATILQKSPTVLVLDALDEVMAIEDRQRLIVAIDELLHFLKRSPNALVVVTTRPRGYDDELEKRDGSFGRLNLVPLDRWRALEYAKRLVEARFDDDRRPVVLRRLQEAAAGETTARLMRSPLQVTILATLVDHIGQAPNERWTLFKEYYRVIYEREMERSNSAAPLLRDYKTYIDKIHTQVGLLLQIEAEHSGGTASSMTITRFRQVVDAVLAEDEIDGAQRDDVTRRLTGETGDRAGSVEQLIGQRLVLLVEDSPGKISFEVRSIQEFMAAWALSLANEQTVERRMWQIAKATSFRNVLLFLASRAFTDLDLRGLRDALVEGLCKKLNEDEHDRLASLTLAGSLLALEILEEGSVLKQVKYLKRLVEIAMRIVELPPSPEHARLVRVLLREPETMRVAQNIVESAITRRLTSAAAEERFGAWVVLLDLAAQGQTWAQTLAETYWKEDANTLGENIGYALDKAEIAPRPWLGDFFGQQLQHLRAFPIHRWLSSSRRDFKRHRYEVTSGPLCAFFNLISNPDVAKVGVSVAGQVSPMSLKVSTIGQDKDVPWSELAAVQDPSPSFAPFVAAARFILNPTAVVLAAECYTLADCFDRPVFEFASRFIPWPLAACLGAARTRDDLKVFAEKARAGSLGDFETWRTAEERWKKSESLEMDECLEIGESMPWGMNIAEHGFPAFAVRRSWSMGDFSLESVGSIVKLLRERLHYASNSFQRTIAAETLNVFIHEYLTRRVFAFRIGRSSELDAILGEFTLADAQALVEATDEYRLDVFAAMRPWKRREPGWAELLDRAGKSEHVSFVRVDFGDFATYVSELYNAEPTCHGLLNVLKLCAVCQAKPAVRSELLSPECFTEMRDRESAWLVRLAQRELSIEEAIDGAKEMAEATTAQRFPLGQAVEILEKVPDTEPHVQPILLTLVQHAPSVATFWRGTILQRLRRMMGAQPTHLDDVEVWSALALPLPHPAPKNSPTPAAIFHLHPPVRIESIHLENVRILQTLDIEPAPPHNGSGQWVVLVGENGTGKTTTLRSLVLALKRIGTLPLRAFEPSFRRYGIDKDTSCAVETKVNGNWYRVRVRPDKQGHDEPVRDERDNEMSAPFFIFAYGARRGSALGGYKRDVNFAMGREIETLFDEAANLVHAETWLLERYYDAETNKGREPEDVWKAIEGALFALLPGLREITVSHRRMWFEGASISKTLISGLSDGYLMTLGWVVDVLARYLDALEERKEHVPPEFNKVMTGLVIIDEPDEYLHPMWQKHLIADIRRVFPKLSFVVTTHNPLTLLGARPEEIWRLEREAPGVITVLRDDGIPALMTAAQILREYFGVQRTFPHPLGEKLERFAFLTRLRRRTPDEEKEMELIQAELRHADVDPGWVPASSQNSSESK